MDKRQTIRRYFQCYRDRDEKTLRQITTPDLHHVSSYAEYHDRDKMLEAVWPMVGKSWATQLQIFGDGSEFMVRYTVEAVEGAPVNMAEYMRFKGDQIAEIEVYAGRPLGV